MTATAQKIDKVRELLANSKARGIPGVILSVVETEALVNEIFRLNAMVRDFEEWVEEWK